ncbi:MAG: hypothetical protein HYW62_03560 [Candidatus Levybacteria bacterium]|nr:hypothetical protein [Candidatus Levybacteria bacterium]
MTQEVLNPGKTPEIAPTKTVLQKVRELWECKKLINIEPRFVGLTLEGKTVNLDNGWIRIATDRYSPHKRVEISIVDNREGRSVTCAIFFDGESYVQLALPNVRMSVGDFTAVSRAHFIDIKPEAKDEEQVMLAFVDWAQRSIDKGTVTEPPYKLENVPVRIESPRTPTSKLT